MINWRLTVWRSSFFIDPHVCECKVIYTVYTLCTCYSRNPRWVLRPQKWRLPRWLCIRIDHIVKAQQRSHHHNSSANKSTHISFIHTHCIALSTDFIHFMRLMAYSSILLTSFFFLGPSYLLRFLVAEEIASHQKRNWMIRTSALEKLTFTSGFLRIRRLQAIIAACPTQITARTRQ